MHILHVLAFRMETVTMATFLVVVIACIGGTLGHGRLRDPPSRSSMWREGFPVPPNYDDTALYCGGFAVCFMCTLCYFCLTVIVSIFAEDPGSIAGAGSHISFIFSLYITIVRRMGT